MPENGAGSERRRARRRRRSARSPHDGAFVALLRAELPTLSVAAPLVLSLIALGGQHAQVIALVAALCVAACVLALRESEPRLAPPALVLFGLAGWTALQTLPLPLRVLSLIAPHNAEIWSRTASVLGEDRHFATISLDPSNSAVEALKWLSYGALFVAAEQRARRAGSARILAVVFGAGLLLALITLGHGLAGATRLFGIYKPTFGATSWALSPLLDSNNRAGYLNLSLFCGLSLTLFDSFRRYRSLIGTGVMVLVGASLLSASRGGVAALFLGALLVGALGVRRLRSASGAGQRWQALLVAAPFALSLCGGVAFALLGANESLWRELLNESLSKLTVIGWSKPMIREFPLLGIGRGAFETVFPAYRQGAGNVRFQYAENFVAQWAAEWGLIIGLGALAALLWWFRPRAAERSALQVARVGIAVLLLQNLVDLALELNAVGLALCALLGALWAEQSPSPPRSEHVVSRRWLLVGGLSLLLPFALYLGWHTAARERDRIQQELVRVMAEDTSGREQVLARVKSQMRLRPADPYLALIGATLIARLPGGNPLPWLGLALQRDVMSGRTHFALASWLARRGVRLQALLELRLAVERDETLAQYAARRALSITNDLEEFRRAVPESKGGSAMLLAAAKRFSGSRLPLLVQAVRLNPNGVIARVQIAELLIGALHQGVVPCDPAHAKACVEIALRHAHEISKLEPELTRGLELEARVLAAQGQLLDALGLLSSQCSRFRAARSCWQLRVGLQRTLPWDKSLDEAVASYLAASCSEPERCADAEAWVGHIFEERNDSLSAISHFSRATDLFPTGRHWLELARSAARGGQKVRASEALTRAEQSPDAPSIADQLSEARSHIPKPMPPH